MFIRIIPPFLVSNAEVATRCPELSLLALSASNFPVAEVKSGASRFSRPSRAAAAPKQEQKLRRAFGVFFVCLFLNGTTEHVLISSEEGKGWVLRVQTSNRFLLRSFGGSRQGRV